MNLQSLFDMFLGQHEGYGPPAGRSRGPYNPASPYGGRTMAQVMSGGVPYAQGANYDAQGNDMFSVLANQWYNTPANDELVGAAIGAGARYQPDFAQELFSSGDQGGWFSIPGTQQESNVPWSLNSPDDSENPRPGLMGMSTNNWRLLPEAYRSPQYAMRAGHIIDRYWTDKPLAYVGTRGGGEAPWGIGGPGHGFPVSTGSSNQRGYFFPGQLEPWVFEGAGGTT